MNEMRKELVMKGGLKLKKGGELFKKPKKKDVDLRKIDITIKKDEEAPKKTKAELAFEQRKHATAFERLSKKAVVSHREKVENFNKQMEEMTEFNEIPRINWVK